MRSGVEVHAHPLETFTDPGGEAHRLSAERWTLSANDV